MLSDCVRGYGGANIRHRNKFGEISNGGGLDSERREDTTVRFKKLTERGFFVAFGDISFGGSPRTACPCTAIPVRRVLWDFFGKRATDNKRCWF